MSRNTVKAVAVPTLVALLGALGLFSLQVEYTREKGAAQEVLGHLIVTLAKGCP